MQLLGEMKKENFGLKLRIYHLEEALRSKHGDKDSGWKLVRGGRRGGREEKRGGRVGV